jgi:hypothetical protein
VELKNDFDMEWSLVAETAPRVGRQGIAAGGSTDVWLRS